MTDKYYLVKEKVKELILKVQTELPRDVVERLRSLNVTGLGKVMLDCMLRNCEFAVAERKPICQDTGTPLFIIKIGIGSELFLNWNRLLEEAYVECVREIPLRPNAVDSVSNRNTGTGVGYGIPVVDVEFVDSDGTEVWYIAKGGGSELPCRAVCVIPEKGWNVLPRFVKKLVSKYGRLVCPPIVIGIGVGATVDSALKLAKRALYLRKLGERNSNTKIAELEEKLIEELNKEKIGIQGVGEGPTVLDVHIEAGCRHPATFCIGIVFSCWVLRRGVLKIDKGLNTRIEV